MTNCKETLEYYSRKESEKRKLVYPAIYRHFKHTEDGSLNNHMYAVMGISEPVQRLSYDGNKFKVRSSENKEMDWVNKSYKVLEHLAKNYNKKLQPKYY